jgi:GT2 family glycosyltransferase
MAFSPMRPSVTVVVPNYNHAAYLDQCLDSIGAQSRQPDRVIIVDDASTDDSLRVIDRFIRQNPTWQLIRNDVNSGVVYGQNVALAATDTGWISYLGADDVLHPRYIEQVVALAESSPSAGLICACAEQFGSATMRAMRPIVLPALQQAFVSPDRFRALLEKADNFFLGTVSTYRCDAVRELDGFDRELGAFSDAMLARRLAVRHGFSFIPRVLGFWRMHGENYSTTTSMDAAAVGEKLARVHRVLADEPPGLFPAGYAATLDRRQRFGGARLLVHGRAMPAALRARKIAALMQAGAGETWWLGALLSGGRLGAVLALAWLTLRLRPTSLPMLLSQSRARRAIVADDAGFRP